MGRLKKFTKRQLEEKWEEYKKYCDDKVMITTEFCQKTSSFVTDFKKVYVTYTIEGFCVWLKLARQNFYATYSEDEKYRDIVNRIKEECETDARQKFETGAINSRLAGIWMSKYPDYKQKQEIELPEQKAIEVVIKSDSDDYMGDLAD